ncbi:uncharacterized protein, partial [Pyxicephalus adspersus]|uniref:uncharacterized protein n=1 Tax=Pyxicephalus adspersus TaxID=30357 RepID=UPI003B5932F1
MSAGHGPIQSQPHWQNTPTFSKSTAIVPPGLECLVEAEDVTLNNKVFQTKDGQTLFTIHRESECCGPSLNLRLRNPYKKDVLSLYLMSSEVLICIFYICLTFRLHVIYFNPQIFGMDSAQPVANIIKEKEGKSSQVIFHFPLNMEAALKAVILAAFLYMSCRIQEMSYSHISSNNDDSWIGAGGVDLVDMYHHHDSGGHNSGD